MHGDIRLPRLADRGEVLDMDHTGNGQLILP